MRIKCFLFVSRGIKVEGGKKVSRAEDAAMRWGRYLIKPFDEHEIT